MRPIRIMRLDPKQKVPSGNPFELVFTGDFCFSKMFCHRGFVGLISTGIGIELTDDLELRCIETPEWLCVESVKVGKKNEIQLLARVVGPHPYPSELINAVMGKIQIVEKNIADVRFVVFTLDGVREMHGEPAKIENSSQT